MYIVLRAERSVHRCFDVAIINIVIINDRRGECFVNILVCYVRLKVSMTKHAKCFKICCNAFVNIAIANLRSKWYLVKYSHVNFNYFVTLSENRTSNSLLIFTS